MATRTIHICDTCKRESTEAMPYHLGGGYSGSATTHDPSAFYYSTIIYTGEPAKPSQPPLSGHFCTIACGLERARLHLDAQTPAPPAPPKKRLFKR